MSESNSSSLFEEKKGSKGDNSKEGWNPFNTTTFPTELAYQNNNIFPTDYSFPPRTSSTPLNFFDDIASVPMLPEVSESPFYREQRSMSYSFGHNDFYNNHHHHFNHLSTIMQEETEEEEEDYYKRTRSKSSAAIMDIWSPSHHVQSDIEDAKWLAAQHNNKRRSSLIPPPEQPQQRRFSLAPPSLLESNYQLNTTQIPSNYQRRHSLAGPTSIIHTKEKSTNTMMNSILELESLSIREQPRHPMTIEDNNNTMMKLDDMGKGTRLDSEILKDAIFYIIEFKGGRSDLYFNKHHFKKNDLVIVEGDRGRDLGKIKKENINRNQLEIYYNRLKKNVNFNNEQDIDIVKTTTHYQPNEIYIKSIFRLAEKDEITLLIAKEKDEAKALMVCQSKIKQKKLTMQVVDAEYQWDRRKLTFYFIAEKRVDFRELVRELFKLYKTRIWMCAVTSITVLD